MLQTPRNRQLVEYIAGTVTRKFPGDIIDAAKRALADFLGVAVGAHNDAPVQPVRATLKRWNAAGNARVFLGGQTTPALGVAATTAGGLVGSFGTHGKPFHAGKAAMDGILAAQLAADGFVAATHLYELGELDKTPRKKAAHQATLLDVFIQDHDVEPLPLDFEQSWEILTNGFKPFASCRATQASTQAARTLAAKIAGRAIQRVHAKVHPNALITAGKLAPRTPLEGKFSVPFCIALALRGHAVVASDFTDDKMHDASIMGVLPVVELEAVQGQPPHSAHLDVYLVDGEHLHADTDIVIGHPDNPMSWDDLRVKFEGLVEPVIGAAKAKTLFDTARHFEQPGSIARISVLLAGAR